MDFGQLLQYYRTAKGLSQSDVAEDAEYSASFISRLESGERGATRESVLKIARGKRFDLSTVEIDRLLLTADLRPIAIGSAMFEPKLAELDDVLYASSTQMREQLGAMIDTALQAGRAAITQSREATAT